MKIITTGETAEDSEMVRFENKEGKEYAVREGITSDDPVGAYMMKRVEHDPKMRTKVGERLTYWVDLLESFEKGSMARREYEEILRRVQRAGKSGAQLTGEKEARRFFDSGLAREIFGDYSGEGQIPEEVLAKAYSLRCPLKEVIGKYVEQTAEKMPEIADYKQKILIAARRGNMKELETLCSRLRNVLDFKLRYGFPTFKQEDEELFKKYLQAHNKGSIFDLADVFEKARNKFPRLKS